VTTGQVAHFTLSCLATGGFARQAPMIAGARRAGHKDPAGTSARRLAPDGEPPELAGGPAGWAGQGRP
jgi:hypothetical protein